MSASLALCLVALLPLLLLTLSCAPAQAGSYTRVYSGGSGTSTPSPKGNGNGTTQNSDGSYSIGGSININGSGSASYAGPITVTFTWVPDNDSDTAPTCVIIAQTSIATATASGDSGSVSCNNGLGQSDTGVNQGTPDAPPPYNATANCTGTPSTYTIGSGGNSFQVTCNPSGNASASGGVVHGACSVNYRCDVTPVVITLSGTTKVSGTDEILIGQGCWAALAGIPADWSVQYSWSVSGTTYGGFTVHYNGDVVGAGGPDPLPSDFAYQSNPFWYWKDDGDKTVSCTACVTLPSADVITINAEKHVTAVAPNADIRYADPMGTVQMLPSGQFGLFGSGNQLAGMYISGWVNTPQEFITATGAGDPGIFGFVQMVDDFLSWTDSSGVTHFFNVNNNFGLDNGATPDGVSSPYWLVYGLTQQAQGDSSNDASWLHITDSPYLNISTFPQVVSTAREFSASTWLMYLPPGTSAWVPLYKFSWDFGGLASSLVPLADGRPYYRDWSVSGAYTHYTNRTWLPEFPSWTSVNSQIGGYTPQ